jgi:hypothetical protein
VCGPWKLGRLGSGEPQKKLGMGHSQWERACIRRHGEQRQRRPRGPPACKSISSWLRANVGCLNDSGVKNTGAKDGRATVANGVARVLNDEDVCW